MPVKINDVEDWDNQFGKLFEEFLKDSGLSL